MTNRENFFNFIKGKEYEKIPFYMTMCDQLKKKFKDKYNIENYEEYFDIPFRQEGIAPTRFPVDYSKYYIGKDIDYTGEWGDGHKYGSMEHFTHFVPCMDKFETVDEINSFPVPDVLADYRWEEASKRIEKLKQQDYIVISNIAIDIFEPAWYLRGMEEMLSDFYINPELAEACLDRIKNVKGELAKRLAQSGVDVIIYGDDVAMQTGMMMSPEIWRKFLKPRLKEVIEYAKSANPNVLAYYHSDGDCRVIIPELIEVGADILNPVQPECMDPKEIYDLYSDKIAFWGGMGTQTTMPFGTVDDVFEKTKELIGLNKKGGKFVIAPTHLLEPEVPLENIIKFVETIKNA